MTTSEYLSDLGYTIEQAQVWILANTDNPQLIFNSAKSLGINSQMLADIMSPVLPGLTADAVESFFSQNGLDGPAINVSNLTPQPSSLESLDVIPEAYADLEWVVQPNMNSGILSNDYLRNAITSVTGTDAYWALFDPEAYDLSGDGLISANELGLSNFSDLYASKESVESIFYGTLINTFKAIDQSEMMDLINAAQSIDPYDPNSVMSLEPLVISIFEDPANPPLYSDAEISELIIMSTTTTVQYLEGDLVFFDPSAFLFG